MKNQIKKHLLTITEETVIIASIFKWVFLASIIGAIVGFVTAYFLKAIDFSVSQSHQFHYYYLLLPLVMVMNGLIVKYIAPDSAGHGTEKVIEAIHRRFGHIRAIVVPIKVITTLMTITVGGSIGKEGPCAQIGAGLASTISNLFRFSEQDRKKLVICGISAGFAAVFGTPVAGAIFGVEVLFIGSILYEILLPSFIAGMVGYHVALSVGVEHSFPTLNFVDTFSAIFFMKVVFAGLFFGLVSFIFIEVMHLGERAANFFNRFKYPILIKGLIGGGALIIIALIFSTDFLGLGTETIDHALSGSSIIWYAFILKAIATSLTLNFGGSGGIITPIFFIGATSGAILSQALGWDPSVFVAIGFVSVLSGTANTPLAASILAIELFGPALAPYATVACVLSFLMSGHRSAYPSQVLSINKSSAIIADAGDDIDHCVTHFKYGTRKILVRSRKLSRLMSILKK